jgi:hypothetical protein
LSYADFTEFLFSPILNGVIAKEHKHKLSDMTQPLAKYFCFSSHNTYLSGHQLKGASDILMYEEALRIGCRCVELDCWDGPNNEPKITHGYTLTSSLTMSSVIKTISEFAFKSSPYPVILSLEMHCKKP